LQAVRFKAITPIMANVADKMINLDFIAFYIKLIYAHSKSGMDLLFEKKLLV